MERMQGDGEMNDLECPSPMTDGERDMIQESWAEVYQNCDDVGVVILVRLFVNFPKSQQYFSKFRDIKEREELERNALLRKHARHVMNAIKALVDNLENPDKMTATLEGIAKAHAIKHDVEPVYFKILGGVILEVLGEQTEIVTPEVGAAWTKLMATIYWGVRAIYKEIGWIKPPSSTG